MITSIFGNWIILNGEEDYLLFRKQKIVKHLGKEALEKFLKKNPLYLENDMTKEGFTGELGRRLEKPSMSEWVEKVNDYKTLSPEHLIMLRYRNPDYGEYLVLYIQKVDSFYEIAWLDRGLKVLITNPEDFFYQFKFNPEWKREDTYIIKDGFKSSFDACLICNGFEPWKYGVHIG